MTSLSSISSSSASRAGAPPRTRRKIVPARTATAPVVGQLARALRRRRSRVWPRGALAAVAIVAVIHFVAAVAVYPEAAPRRDVRRKLIGLTRGPAAQIIIAGDSRAECGLMPGVLAERIGADADRAINMAAPACDLPGVVAGYREFAGRFATAPIMIASVSVLDVNDRAAEQFIGDETLWSLSPVERLRLAPPKRAVLSLFMPERELLRRAVLEPLLLNWDTQAVVPEQGYRGEASRHHYPPQRLGRELEKLDRAWFNQPVFDGVRWRLFRKSVRELRDAGVQLVLLDTPAHPDYVAAIAGTPMGEADECFHRQLADYCRSKHVPLLRFTAEDICEDAACADDPGSSFVSLLHLNRTGAARLSNRVGDALADLIARGVFSLPDVAPTASAD